jgi:aromatic-L-amino-acid decarboxylase
MTDHPLEPDRRAMEEMGRRALALVADFVDGLPDAPASNVDDIEARLPEYLRPPGEGPGDLGELLDRFGEAAAVAVETAGPRYMAYVGGGGRFTSALAEMVARALNGHTTLSSFAPALVALEESTLRWLCRQFGLPDTAGRCDHHRGVAGHARGDGGGPARPPRRGLASGTVYVTAHTHRCLAKAARLAGLPAGAIRTVATTSAWIPRPRRR